MKQIEAVFDTYDYLLVQLGDSDKIFLEAGSTAPNVIMETPKKHIPMHAAVNTRFL
jgi:hypothetical protein